MTDARTVDAVLDGRARWAVVHANCLDVLAMLPNQCAAHVVTDPPYEAEAHTLGRRLKTTSALGGGGVEMLMKPLSFAPLTEAIRSEAGKQIARLARRWAVVFCQVEAAMLWRDALAPLAYRRTCVWVKPDGMPQYSGDRPGMGYESIVCAHGAGRSVWNGGGRVGVFVHNKNSGGKHQHETQKPLPLMLELIDLFTDPGDVILDPFAGSGTTGVAAIARGRRAILIESDSAYAALCEQRMCAQDTRGPMAAQEVMFR